MGMCLPAYSTSPALARYDRGMPKSLIYAQPCRARLDPFEVTAVCGLFSPMPDADCVLMRCMHGECEM